jgi:hypothetical protein
VSGAGHDDEGKHDPQRRELSPDRFCQHRHQDGRDVERAAALATPVPAMPNW